MSAERITIVETTVGVLSGVRVGVANVWDEDYETEAGEAARGVRGTLAFMGDDPEDDFDQRVVAGDVVRVNGESWRVVAVTEPPTGLGSITLERQ